METDSNATHLPPFVVTPEGIYEVVALSDCIYDVAPAVALMRDEERWKLSDPTDVNETLGQVRLMRLDHFEDLLRMSNHMVGAPTQRQADCIRRYVRQRLNATAETPDPDEPPDIEPGSPTVELTAESYPALTREMLAAWLDFEVAVVRATLPGSTERKALRLFVLASRPNDDDHVASARRVAKLLRDPFGSAHGHCRSGQRCAPLPGGVQNAAS